MLGACSSLSAITTAISQLFNQQKNHLGRMAFVSLSTAGEVHQDNVLVVFDANINLISCRCINIFKLNKTLWVFIIFSFDSNSNTGGNLQQEMCSSTLAGSLYSSQCRWGQMTFCGLHYAWTMKVNIACQVMPLAIDVWIGRDWGRKKKKTCKSQPLPALNSLPVTGGRARQSGYGGRCIWIAVTS